MKVDAHIRINDNEGVVITARTYKHHQFGKSELLAGYVTYEFAAATDSGRVWKGFVHTDSESPYEVLRMVLTKVENC